ncbi:alpha/beta fold hydrolase [Terriglobus sp. 2YAB30_2]|uniref:alpha/beta fold hydrolase n=1 Tax=unclassified Terriglobus TaxID=2628988 RepID=UPI003F961304
MSTHQNTAFHEMAPVLEHRIPRDGHSLYAKEFPGRGPTFVMLHGFPDNHHIYDPLGQFLANSGRHVVAFDFLGFGSSDKPQGYAYSYDQQLADLDAVVDHLNLQQIVPVGHDSGGFVAINYLLALPERIAHLCLLNTFYTNTATLRPPELIQFFATPGVNAIAQKMAEDPAMLDFLLTFQQSQFKAGGSGTQQAVIDDLVRPIIQQNFAQTPSAAPAFVQLAGGLFPQLGKNAASLARLKEIEIPCSIIWGDADAYLNLGVAKEFAATFRGASKHVLDAGHWVQLDLPEQVGRLMLSEVRVQEVVSQ